MEPSPKPHWIAGEARSDGPQLEVENRALSSFEAAAPAARVSLADAPALERALDAAHQARHLCATLPRHVRRRALLGVAAGLERRSEELAHTIAIESAKPLRDARGEVTRAVTTFELAAEACDERAGELLDLGARASVAGYLALTRRVPVGVVGAITPFNFPLNLVAHKLAPAIAAGCPIVLKPSERTPLSALALAELLAEQDLPAGSWSILPMEVPAAGALIDDERVALVSFTGSEAVGWEIARRAAGRRVALELGGNAACIVEEVEDLDHLVERVVTGATSNSGQSCISVQRLLVRDTHYEAVAERLVTALEALPVGRPLEQATRVGPLIDDAAAARVESWIGEAVAGGARVLTGGARSGRVVTPTLVTDVPLDARLETDEVFGPVLGIAPYRALDDAVRRADSGRFGLQLGVFGVDLDRGLELADRVEVGGLVLGDVPTFRADAMPYGGRRRSGLGREGPRSAIEEFTEPQVIALRRRPGGA